MTILRFVDGFGGEISAEAPLVRYRPSLFADAVAGDYLDPPSPNLCSYRLTEKARDLLHTRLGWRRRARA